MKRIGLAALIFMFVTAGAFSAPKSKIAKTAAQKGGKQTVSLATVVAPLPLSALFPPDDAQSVTDDKGMVSMPTHEVVMVRINADGTRSRACVNNEAAARAFLTGPKAAASKAPQSK